MKTELVPDDLYRRCDPRDVPFETTADASETVEVLGQRRAIDATRFEIGIRHDGYNLFALGPAGLGKRTILRELLGREAAQKAPPSDCHVYNALRLPQGAASRRADMARAVSELRAAMPAAFDSEEYRSRRHGLIDTFEQRQKSASKTSRNARTIAVSPSCGLDTGIVLAPLRGDAALDPEELAKLTEKEQAELKETMERVGGEVQAMFTSSTTGRASIARPSRRSIARSPRASHIA
jgi:hypothetical protein